MTEAPTKEMGALKAFLSACMDQRNPPMDGDKMREAMRALATPAPQAAPDLSQWEKRRFGVFLEDGRFEELTADDPCGEKHPRGHTSRWVGGHNDVQLLRAFLAAAPTPEAAAQAQVRREALTPEEDSDYWKRLIQARQTALEEAAQVAESEHRNFVRYRESVRAVYCDPPNGITIAAAIRALASPEGRAPWMTSGSV